MKSYLTEQQHDWDFVIMDDLMRSQEKIIFLCLLSIKYKRELQVKVFIVFLMNILDTIKYQLLQKIKINWHLYFLVVHMLIEKCHLECTMILLDFC